MLRTISLIALLGLGISLRAVEAPEGSVVEQNGRLQVKGAEITNQMGNTVSLAGMSLFWSQWGGGFFNESCINWLATDWKCSVVRAAMAIESDGYLTNPAIEKAKVEAVVDACIKAGIYVIIDWHDHNAQNHKTQAIAFFKEMATKYGSYPNVIYEIFNEPLQVSWSGVIKPYAVDVIKAIREVDPDNLILVGNTDWDQKPLDCANDPIADVNVAYTFHFYVGQHGIAMASNAISAKKKGAPIFVSEWGLWGSDAELEAWVKFMKDNKLSWCNWSVNTKDEPSSALLSGASEKGNWKTSQLTSIGLKVRNYIQNWGPVPQPKPQIAYASVKYPSKVIDIHFSQALKSIAGADTCFIISNGQVQVIDSVYFLDADRKKISIALNTIQSANEASLKLSYSGNSIVAENGQKLSPFSDITIYADTVGASPYIVSLTTDSFGDYIIVRFNKAMQAPDLLASGFDVKSTDVSMLDSVKLSDTSAFILYTKKFFRENQLVVNYVPGSVKAIDNGQLAGFGFNKVENVSYPEAPKVIQVKLASANSCLVSFDKPVSTPKSGDLGCRLIRTDVSLGIVDTMQIISFENRQFSLLLKFDEYLNNTQKLFIVYHNGLVKGSNTPYGIADIDSMVVENKLPAVPIIKKSKTCRIEAENYSDMLGIKTETTTDAGAGLNVAFIENTDWMDYSVNVEDTGSYTVTFRVAAELVAGTVVLKQMSIEQSDLVTLNLPITKGWQKWANASGNVKFSQKGLQVIRVFVKKGGWNLNWFEFGMPTQIMQATNNNYNVYPTIICDNTIFLQSNGSEISDVVFRMYSMSGVLVFTSNLREFTDKTIIHLPSGISNGAYSVIISAKNKVPVNKIVVVNRLN